MKRKIIIEVHVTPNESMRNDLDIIVVHVTPKKKCLNGILVVHVSPKEEYVIIWNKNNKN